MSYTANIPHSDSIKIMTTFKSHQVRKNKSKFPFFLRVCCLQPSDQSQSWTGFSSIKHSGKLKNEKKYYRALKSSLNHQESQGFKLTSQKWLPKLHSRTVALGSPKIRKLSSPKDNGCQSPEVTTVRWPSWTGSWCHTKPDML